MSAPLARPSRRLPRPPSHRTAHGTARRTRRTRRTRLAALAVLGASVLAVGACSGDADGGDDGARTAPPVTLPDELVPAPETSTTATTSQPGATTTTTDSTTTGQVAFELDPRGRPQFAVEAPFSCRGETVTVTARWSARNATAAGFVVDETPLTATVPPEGPFELQLPCDGRGHNIVLVLTGADGSQALATRAVLVADEG